MRERLTLGTLCSALLLSALVGAASAQSGTTDQGQADVPTLSGPLTVERIPNGPVAAPDLKLTDFDGEFGTLVGGYAGWLSDQRLLIGGAGYWLSNGSDAHKLAYGGLLAGWHMNGDGRIAFGVRGLLGAGQATLADEVTVFASFGDGGRDRLTRRGTGSGSEDDAVVRRYLFDTAFFVFEPQGTLVVRLTNSIRLDCGIGYRLIGDGGSLDDRLQGISGSIAIRFGGGK